VQKPSAIRLSLAHLDWPFFGPEHRVFAARLDSWIADGGLDGVDHSETY
jgi:acyl-CoA dehydrogenase